MNKLDILYGCDIVKNHEPRVNFLFRALTSIYDEAFWRKIFYDTDTNLKHWNKSPFEGKEAKYALLHVHYEIKNPL